MGRPIRKEDLTIADELEGPELGKARFVVPDEVETSYQLDPLPRLVPNEALQLNRDKQRMASLARRKNPLKALRDENNEVIYFITNRPTLPYDDDSKPWATFQSRLENYGPTEKMRIGAVLVETDSNRVRGTLPGSRIKKLLGAYEGASGTEAQNEAAANFIHYLWGEDILLYIHGYNVSFEDAVIQAGQLKRDLDYAGPIVALSWASLADPRGYFEDEKTVRKSIGVISQMLEYLIDGNTDPASGFDCPPGKLNIISHSMGNWVFLNSVGLLNLQRRFYERSFNNVVLAAPDVNKGSLIYLGPVISKGSKRVTLYYSSKDVPLALSLFVHQGKRAGQESYDISGIDLVDVNSVNEVWLRYGHSAYAASDKVLQDIRLQFNYDLDPIDRKPLKLKERPLSILAPPYSDWEFPVEK